MPALEFSGAHMSVVGYGEVVGADGSSPQVNSGQFRTVKIGAGAYRLEALDGSGQVPADLSKDLSLVFIQIKNSTGVGRNSVVNPTAPDGPGPFGSYFVTIFNGANQAVDADFYFLVARSTIPPVPGSTA